MGIEQEATKGKPSTNQGPCERCDAPGQCQQGLTCAGGVCVPSGSVCGGVGWTCEHLPERFRLVCRPTGEAVCRRRHQGRDEIRDAAPFCRAS